METSNEREIRHFSTRKIYEAYKDTFATSESGLVYFVLDTNRNTIEVDTTLVRPVALKRGVFYIMRAPEFDKVGTPQHRIINLFSDSLRKYFSLYDSVEIYFDEFQISGESEAEECIVIETPEGFFHDEEETAPSVQAFPRGGDARELLETIRAELSDMCARAKEESYTRRERETRTTATTEGLNEMAQRIQREGIHDSELLKELLQRCEGLEALVERIDKFIYG